MYISFAIVFDRVLCCVVDRPVVSCVQDTTGRSRLVKNI
jgi:hypothetical protein